MATGNPVIAWCACASASPATFVAPYGESGRPAICSSRNGRRGSAPYTAPMAASVELRPPFLDHRPVELTSLPSNVRYAAERRSASSRKLPASTCRTISSTARRWVAKFPWTTGSGVGWATWRCICSPGRPRSSAPHSTRRWWIARCALLRRSQRAAPDLDVAVTRSKASRTLRQAEFRNGVTLRAAIRRAGRGPGSPGGLRAGPPPNQARSFR